MKNNNSLFFKDWTIKKLKEEHKGYKQSEQTGYSCKDTHNIIGIELELEERGVKF